MKPGDPPALAEVFAHMNKSREVFERYWRENVDGKRVTLVAELEGQIVGYTNVIWEPVYEPFRLRDIPEINDMNVVVPFRRNGIGTRMIEAAEGVARGKGKTTVGIGVGVTADYAIAQRLYPKLGYEQDGTGVHEDEWGGCIYSTKQLGA